jgi:hypothetical protein
MCGKQRVDAIRLRQARSELVRIRRSWWTQLCASKGVAFWRAKCEDAHLTAAGITGKQVHDGGARLMKPGPLLFISRLRRERLMNGSWNIDLKTFQTFRLLSVVC